MKDVTLYSDFQCWVIQQKIVRQLKEWYLLTIGYWSFEKVWFPFRIVHSFIEYFILGFSNDSKNSLSLTETCRDSVIPFPSVAENGSWSPHRRSVSTSEGVNGSLHQLLRLDVNHSINWHFTLVAASGFCKKLRIILKHVFPRISIYQKRNWRQT